MKFIYLAYIALSLLLCGCYDDKGNYDYTPLNRIEIENFDMATYYLGDLIELKPVLTFSIDSTEDNLLFEWTIFGNKKIYSHDLSYIADTLGSGFIVLRVKDTVNGIEYSASQSCTIKTEYEADGYMILSKGANNESILSYIKLISNPNYSSQTGVGETNFYTCADYYDVYHTTNNESLGRGPLKLLQHFHSSNTGNSSEVGAFWIFQEEPECFDISGVSFQKDITLTSQFMDGMPTGFKPYDMVDMTWSSFVIGQDGTMYSRKKETEYLFNSGLFLNNAVTFEEDGTIYPVSGKEVIHHRYSTAGYTPFFEKTLNRFLLMLDGSQQNGGQISSPDIPGDNIYTPRDAAKIDNLGDMEMICCNAVKVSWGNKFYAILKDPNGVFYSYTFDMGDAYYGRSPGIEKVVQAELPASTQSVLNSIINGSSKNIFKVGYANTEYSSGSANNKQLLDYVLITKDNELYLLERKSGEIILYDSFDATITSIDTESWNAWMAGIGLENGKFHIMELTNAGYSQEHPRRMYSSETNFGEIVDIRFKNGASWQ